MQINRDPCIRKILVSEGGEYTDGVHPYDPGGPTRWGITIADARMYWKPNATPEDVKTMPMSVAVGIYVKIYWTRVWGDQLPGGIDYSIVDYGVNSGVSRAIKVLQAVVDVTRDGRMGPATLAAVQARDPDKIVDAICDERMHFLQSLRIWPTYKNGWTTRVLNVRAYSHTLAKQAETAQPPQEPKPILANAVQEEPTAKAIVPSPKAPQSIIAGSAASAGGASYTWWDWVQAHPINATMLGVGVIIILAGIVVIIYRNHKRKAEEPHPLVQVVPPKGGTA